MARLQRISPPPHTGNSALDSWLLRLSDALNALPATYIFSGNPNDSGVTATAGSLGINVDASATTSRIWINTSGTTNSWSRLSQLP